MIPFPDGRSVSLSNLAFRSFRGARDFPAMVGIMNATARVDKLEYNETVEDVARVFAHLANCDPYQDMIFAEVDGRPIAYGLVFWRDEITGLRLYTSLGFIDAEFRRHGLGRVLLAWNQARLAEIARTHDPEIEKAYNAYAVDTSPGGVALLESSGYEMARRFAEVIRPIDPPPSPVPLPGGLRIVPVDPAHYPAVWAARAESHADHWGFIPPTAGDYERWLNERRFQPHLWKIAWDGAEVAGAVLNHVDVQRNAWSGKRRGYTQDVFVRRPWRRRGLARALLTESIVMFRTMGMEETLLGVDTTNPSGEHRLYADVGYRPVMSHLHYRKPFTI
ncbi:MAG: GNAT family N-acetyltransferase [Candidatus Bipolaricaulis sp.]|nr:GNAT family N-acetyltransferase [Candidatus Bipolaricaulis sp.]MDD5647018.1 GNAT family N-acetyltransferase [Candidatus Bipolaricaulis sp.]